MLSALGSDGNWCHFDDLETIKVFNSRFKRRQYQIGKTFCNTVFMEITVILDMPPKAFETSNIEKSYSK
ncbi:MAG: hypothetical protein JWN92_2425 [Candidatus Acidoferrum typicum]|nr:hypothetical protein [Candidatus Acidoferrum typicum]